MPEISVESRPPRITPARVAALELEERPDHAHRRRLIQPTPRLSPDGYQGVMAAGDGDTMAVVKRDIALCLLLVSVVGITGIVVFSIPTELCAMTPRPAGN